MIDYHLHTKRCHHAVGDVEEYLEEAAAKGLVEVGFADHFPLDLLGYCPKHPVTMAGQELEAYIKSITDLASRSGRPRVRLGIEVDYLPGKERETRFHLQQYPFDYVMGSVHFIEDWDFSHPQQEKGFREGCIESIYEAYFDRVRKMAASRLFDMVGHIDVIKKFGYHSSEEHMAGIIEAAVAVIGEADLCVEFNTSGWRAPVGEQYPSRAFLQALFREGIPVTLGSDAHCPSHVGEGIRRGVEVLKDVGYRRAALFRRRKRCYINL